MKGTPHAPAFPKLLVADVDRSITLYEALGFEVIQRDAVFTHLRFAPGADVWLVRTPRGKDLEGRRGVGVLLCFHTHGVDALASRARHAGATVDGPVDQPWHTREIVVTDPDGYRLNFLQNAWADDGPPDAA